jgi:hypothetical protein
MTANSGSHFPFRWENLIDPTRDNGRCTIVLSATAWRHITERHQTSPDEPWNDWLGASPEAAHAASVLHRDVRSALARPLILEYEVYPLGRPAGRWPRRWLIVMPSGALLVVRIRPNERSHLVATCYFTGASCAERDPGRRWLRTAHALVWRYARIDSQLRGLVARQSLETLPFPQKGDLREVRTRVRFVSPTQWGFSDELRGVWRDRLAPWPGTVSPKKTGKTKLTRRRRMEDLEDDHV